MSNNYTQRFFWPSSIYYSDDLTWCVHRVEPLSLLFKIRYVATKATWICCYVAVSTISVIVMFIMNLKKDQFGIMNTAYAPQGIIRPVSANHQNNLQTRIRSPNNYSILKIPYGILLAVCILLTIAWNFFLIKTIAQTFPDYQARSVDDIIERNFRLSGDVFSKAYVWKDSKVN